jgi:hypothetical protein
MLRQNLVSACPVVISLITVGGFIDFGISASHTYQLFVERPLKVTSSNIFSFQDMKTLVAKFQTSLQIFNFTLGSVLLACNTFESLFLDTQGLASLVQNYSAISVECKNFSFGSAIEFSGVSLVLTKLVESGHFSPSSFLIVNAFGYIASPYGYMSVLDCYDMVLLQALIGKNSMKINKSIIVDFHKPIMQHVIISTNLPFVAYYVAPSIVSLTYNGRRDTSILVANFGVIFYHDECEQTTLFNIDLASKTIIIFIDLEDKIKFRGVGNDIINIVLIPCLF